MKLYLLKRRNGCGYDETAGFVVRARSFANARKVAGLEAGDEGGNTWRSSATSSCELIRTEGKEEVILRDFNAG